MSSESDNVYRQYAEDLIYLSVSLQGYTEDVAQIPAISRAVEQYNNDCYYAMQLCGLYGSIPLNTNQQERRQQFLGVAKTAGLDIFFSKLEKGTTLEDFAYLPRVLAKSALFKKHADQFEKLRATYIPNHPPLLPLGQMQAEKTTHPHNEALIPSKSAENFHSFYDSWLSTIASDAQKKGYERN